MISAIYWDPNPKAFTIPYLEIPILWYGVLFAAGFVIGFPVFVDILTRYLGADQKKKAEQLTDKLTFYMVVATVVGARLGHFLFYERPSEYLNDPMTILKIWEGGLASHGAAIAIPIALYLFSKRHPIISTLKLLDFVSVPTTLAGFCIRLGNFINQEILGTPTNVPWAVIFGHPADRSYPIPRHPVQLYEALFYLATFALLYLLTRKRYFLRTPGVLFGLFLTLVFGFRFVVEYLKLEQSHLSTLSNYTMGQLLSIPAIIVGLYFLLRNLPFKRAL